jgi:predicted lipoprotein with Yx(FWY)xxD motif
MKTWLGIIAACTTLVFGVAACGDDESESNGGASAAETTTGTGTEVITGKTSTSVTTRFERKPRRGRTIKVTDSRYGRILFDGRDRAIYLFTREKGTKSRCYGECAVAWPPVYTRGRPRAGAGADASLLGTTKRRGGRRQVTYNGHPLYYYVTDTKPGQITCQDVTEFGGTWLVVDPQGNAIQ